MYALLCEPDCYAGAKSLFPTNTMSSIISLFDPYIYANAQGNPDSALPLHSDQHKSAPLKGCLCLYWRGAELEYIIMVSPWHVLPCHRSGILRQE